MKKKGAIKAHEKNYQRKGAIEAANKAQELNEGKVPIQIDKRTRIYVKKSEYEYFARKARIERAQKKENQDKVKFLQKNGWFMGVDGLWRSPRLYLLREFEAALSIANYYDTKRLHKS